MPREFEIVNVLFLLGHCCLNIFYTVFYGLYIKYFKPAAYRKGNKNVYAVLLYSVIVKLVKLE